MAIQIVSHPQIMPQMTELFHQSHAALSIPDLDLSVGIQIFCGPRQRVNGRVRG
jgi:hypothetical protein